MNELSIIANLRSQTGMNNGDVIYVKGHSTAGDGGGGFFYWNTSSALLAKDDNDGTIVKLNSGNPNVNSGRWIRQIDGYVNVRFFGAKGDWSNDTVKIQRAIDFAAGNDHNSPLKGSTVFIPNGIYGVEHLKMRRGVSLVGESSYTTTIINIETPLNNYPYLITSDVDYLQIKISNIRFYGSTVSGQTYYYPNSTKGCFRFTAAGPTPPAYFQGGVWHSKFTDINIVEFHGHCIHLEGGQPSANPELNYRLVNQFTVFEQVRVSRKKEFANAIRITGSTGQITFLNCVFDAIYTDTIPKMVLKGHNIYIEGGENYHIPAVLLFLNSTSQFSEYGAYIKKAESITFDTCWFENLERAITVVDSKSINILNNRFADASGYSDVLNPGEGRCISIFRSQVNVLNNYVTSGSAFNTGFYEYFLAVDSPELSLGVNTSGNFFNESNLGNSYGVVITYSTVPVNNPGDLYPGVSVPYLLNMNGNKAVYAGNQAVGTTQLIKNIRCLANAGEYIYIQARNGNLTFDTTGNILLATKSTLTINQGESVVFIKTDVIYTKSGKTYREVYNLVSVAEGP